MADIKPSKAGIVYKTVGKLDIMLDLYLPSGGKGHPILLWFHGGGLLQGYRDRLAPHMRRASRERGLAVITADYRLSPQASIQDILEDVQDCIRFVRGRLSSQVENDRLDSSRLAVSGSSAGGYLALLAGIYVEPKPDAIIPIYPITDPLGTFFTNRQPPPPEHTLVPQAQLAEFLDPHAAQVAFNAPDSPRSNMYTRMMHDANLAKLWHVPEGTDANKFRLSRQIQGRGSCPAYFLHGDADVAVGVEQADEVVGAMLGCGIEVIYERPHAQGHLLDHGADYDNDKMYDFIREKLGMKG